MRAKASEQTEAEAGVRERKGRVRARKLTKTD